MQLLRLVKAAVALLAAWRRPSTREQTLQAVTRAKIFRVRSVVNETPVSLDKMTTPSPPASNPKERDERTAAVPAQRPDGLARDILVILAIKAVVLLLIWWVWFSAPEARHMQVPPERVQQRVIEAPTTQGPHSAQSFTSGNQDHVTR